MDWPELPSVMNVDQLGSEEGHLVLVGNAPEDAPSYSNMSVTGSVEGGFQYGVTKHVGGRFGDLFVVAPDGSTCGVIWSGSPFVPVIRRRWDGRNGRWAVYEVDVPLGPRPEEVDEIEVVLWLLPLLSDDWRNWRDGRAPTPQPPNAAP